MFISDNCYKRKERVLKPALRYSIYEVFRKNQILGLDLDPFNIQISCLLNRR